MKESICLYEHCLRSLDYVQIHTTGTDTSLRLGNFFLWAQVPLSLMLRTLACKAKHARPHFISNSARDAIF